MVQPLKVFLLSYYVCFILPGVPKLISLGVYLCPSSYLASINRSPSSKQMNFPHFRIRFLPLLNLFLLDLTNLLIKSISCLLTQPGSRSCVLVSKHRPRYVSLSYLKKHLPKNCYTFLCPVSIISFYSTLCNIWILALFLSSLSRKKIHKKVS